MFKNKDLTIFIRYGGLDLKNHKKNRKKDKYHTPPANRGIYAFPLCAIEYYLIGAIDEFQKEIFPKKPKYPYHKEINDKLSDEDQLEWDNIYDAFDYDNHEKQVEHIKRLIRKTFKKSKGTIWHHLEKYLNRKSIILNRCNSWVKTSIKDWQKAFIKSSMYDRYYDSKNINNVLLFGYSSKDHYEVFFDEKV